LALASTSFVQLGSALHEKKLVDPKAKPWGDDRVESNTAMPTD